MCRLQLEMKAEKEKNNKRPLMFSFPWDHNQRESNATRAKRHVMAQILYTLLCHFLIFVSQPRVMLGTETEHCAVYSVQCTVYYRNVRRRERKTNYKELDKACRSREWWTRIQLSSSALPRGPPSTKLAAKMAAKPAASNGAGWCSCGQWGGHNGHDFPPVCLRGRGYKFNIKGYGAVSHQGSQLIKACPFYLIWPPSPLPHITFVQFPPRVHPILYFCIQPLQKQTRPIWLWVTERGSALLSEHSYPPAPDPKAVIPSTNSASSVTKHKWR